MAKTVALLSFALSILFTTGVIGGVIEFELPELAGMTADTSLTTTFVYRGPNGSVNLVSARVTGTVDYLGLIECFTVPPDTSEWPLDIGTSIRKQGETGYWSGWPGFLEQIGPFDDTYIHHIRNNGFTTLSDGDIVQVDLYFFPAALVGLCHPITAPSTATLSRASILLDVSAPVPVEESTWGRIKALYRAPN